MAGKNDPLISIVIPVYNGANYLAQAIDSALAQTYRNFEILVVNDGSDDNGKTRKIALSYGDRIRYFEKENGGVATALNLGIREMHGEYFSWLSHDDMYAPNKLEVQAKVALFYDEPVVVYSNVNAFSANASAVECKILPQAKESMRCFLAFDVKTGLNGCSLLLPRAVFENHGVFDPGLRYTQDYDLWFRLAEHVRFVGVEECLVLSRTHQEQGSRSNSVEYSKMGDDLHASMIQDISKEELRKFVRENLDYVLESYRVFKNAGYIKTSAKILPAILKHAEPAISSRLRFEFVEELLQWPGQNIKAILSSSCDSEERRKRRILFYSNVFVLGGIERVISSIAEQIKEDYEIFLISGESEITGEFPLPKEVKHLKIRNADFHNIPQRLTHLSVLLEIDLFIGCPNLVERFLNVYPLLHDVGIKNISWNHNNYFLPMDIDWAIPVACKRNEIFKKVSAAVWLTSFSAGVYAGVNPNGAFMPNPNTFPEDPNPEDAENRAEKIVLCVGRFYDPIKRIDLMLEVFRRVLDFVPEAKLCLVGDYSLNARVPAASKYTIRDRLERLGLNDSRVNFAGKTDKVREYYGNASVLMMTSDSEGFGMVLNEAAQMGVPSVLFDIPGVDELIEHEKNGYIVPHGNLEEMARKIANVLSDDDLRRTLGINAQEMSQRFSQKRIGLRWKDLIETILHSDGQTELNALLSQKFGPRIEDRNRFMQQVIRCYERQVLKFAKSSINASKLDSDAFSIMAKKMRSTAAKVRRRMKMFGIVRFVYYQMYDPLVRPILRRGKRAILNLLGRKHGLPQRAE